MVNYSRWREQQVPRAAWHSQVGQSLLLDGGCGAEHSGRTPFGLNLQIQLPVNWLRREHLLHGEKKVFGPREQSGTMLRGKQSVLGV